MSKKILLILTILISLKGFCQDKEAIAKVHYINAEELFNKQTAFSYDQCISELEKAEKALDTTNYKILY